jgi:hypothetical protein
VRASPRGVLAGVDAALRSAAWIDGPRLRELLEPPQPARERAPPRGATGAALLMLRLLPRLPGGRWRNTCLYRSVAECLVLRRYGVPALVKLGVRSGEGAIEAHAWVERADRPPSAEAAHQPLVLRA